MGKGILPTSPLTPFTLEKKKSEGGSERKKAWKSTQTRKIDKEDQSNKMKEIETHRT